jgi:hypothetical protein
MMKKALLYISFLISNLAIAQLDVNLQFMPSVVQQSSINPAYLPNHRFTLSGDINQGFYNSFGGVRLENNKLVTNSTNNNEYFMSNTQWNVAALGLRVKNTFIGAAFNLRSLNYLQLSGDGLQLALQGNGGFVGKTVALNPDAQFLNYSETGLWAAQKLGKLSIGARIKYLNGISAISSNKTNLSLTTDSDIYQLTLNTDYELFTAPSKSIDDLIDGVASVNDLIKGRGIGFDFGASYQLNDKIKINASYLDAGKINWTGTKHKSNIQTKYDGIDATNIFTENESLDIAINMDTLINRLNFQSTDNQSLSTSTPSSWFLSGAYQVTEKLSVAAMYANTSYRNSSSNAMIINGQYQLSSFLNIGLSGGLRNASPIMGANVTLEKGMFQLFALSDNVLGLFNPLESSNVNGRIGLCLRFGKID